MVQTRLMKKMKKEEDNSGGEAASNRGPGTKKRQRAQNTNVTLLTAKDIVMSSFPNCLTNEDNHVRSSALHRLKYVGPLVHWTDFQKQVRQIFKSREWKDYQKPLDIKFRDTTGNANALGEEHFMSGNELSTNSRYVQHVLHVMSAVAKEIGIGVYFGDWDASNSRKASKRGKKGKGKKGKGKKGKGKKGQGEAQKPQSSEMYKDVDLQPDFALLDSDFVPRAVGEGKTPFEQHKFFENVVDAVAGFDARLRNVLGQPARYMQAFNCTFGFITNYKHTIFLRQVCVAGSWRLMYSDAIPYDQESTMRPVKVSVREAMLYLQVAASGEETDWTSHNTTPPEKWVEIPESPKKDGKTERGPDDVGGDRGEAEEEERPSENDEDAGNDEPGSSRKKKKVAFKKGTK